MSVVDIAIVTCSEMPEPDVDQALLEELLTERGLSWRLVAWDDESFDWSTARMALVRSTWDYHLRPKAFADWINVVSQKTLLQNDAQTMRSNIRKRYLLELESKGVAIVPTELIDTAAPDKLLQLKARGWEKVVIKPEVSGGSYETIVAEVASEAARTHLESLLDQEISVLIQPYIPSVDTHGERCLIFIEGELQHAIRKNPRFEGQDESVSQSPVEVSALERDFAEAVLKAANAENLLYARVDLTLDENNGEPLLMELELIEPSLFLKQSPSTAKAFADAIKRRLPS